MRTKHIERFRRQLKHINKEEYPAMYELMHRVVIDHDKKKIKKILTKV